jgi:glycosyltransferase involved in cell wall biosynthesis
MNILHVIASMDPVTGGPSQGLRNIVPVLIKLGVNSQVVCVDDPKADFLNYDTFPVYPVGKGKGLWHYQKNLTTWLCNNIQEFDIIIIHGLWLFHGYAVYKALIKQKNRNNKIPGLYIMPHGMLDPYFQKAKGRKLKAIRNWFYWKLIEAKIVNHADGILFTCMGELVLARKTFNPYHPKQELNVGYGIAQSPAFTAIQQKAFLEKCPGAEYSSYILFLGRIHKKKGVDILIRVYLLLKKKNNSLPKLVIAGPGLDTVYGQQMKKLAVGTNNILFPGMLIGDAKWGALYGCEAFILPSHQENFGIAIVEAMACGKPVLISNKVNIWREIEAGGGAIVADDTLKGTLQLLTAWSKMDKEKREKMSNAALQTFAEKFTIEKAASDFLKAINVTDNFKMKVVQHHVQ